MNTLARIAFFALATSSFAAESANAGDDGASHPKSMVHLVGSDLTSNAWISYYGFLLSAGGDLSQPGWTFFGAASIGNYEYDTLGLGSQDIDVDYRAGHLMVGYTAIRNGIWLGGYVGVDVQRDDLSPNDPTNSVAGTDVGAKFAAELLTIDQRDLFVSAYGSYSTAFDRYFARFQVGPQRDGYAGGLELTALGDDEWDGQRTGAFVKVPLTILGANAGTVLSLSGGYQFSDRDSAEGGYGVVELKFLR
jgi:hypothetical protein